MQLNWTSRTDEIWAHIYEGLRAGVLTYDQILLLVKETHSEEFSEHGH